MAKIVFCIPGKNYSNNFLLAWTATIVKLIEAGHQLNIVNKYTSNVFFVRNMCLGGNVLAGKEQKPFQGQLEYDYMFWIDSDIVFSPSDVLSIINSMEADKSKNVLSGLYLMEGGRQYATVDKDNFDLRLFIQNGGSFPFMRRDEILLKRDNMFEVEYTGFGFMCVRKGVFEKLPYPWFKPMFIEFDVDVVKNPAQENSDDNIKMEINEKLSICDTSSEDVAWCRAVIEKGETIWCDPKIIVGHEKSHIEYYNSESVVKQLKEQGDYEEQLEKLQKVFDEEKQRMLNSMPNQ